MDKQIVEHTHNGILFNPKTEGNSIHGMELEDIMVSEISISHRQKNTL
jgi:hypothetical protein